MPLSVDNIIQQNTGGFEASSGAATLAATTAGSVVVICVGIGIAGGVSTRMEPPSGFTYISGFNGYISAEKTGIWIFGKRVSAGETSWTFAESNSLTVQATWVAMEITGVDANVLNTYAVTTDPTAALTYNATATTINSGVTLASPCYDSLVFAVHSARNTTTTIPTWSGQDNGFTELVESSNVNATNAVSIAVSYKPSLAVGSYTCTATVSPTGIPAAGMVVALFADGARHAPNMDVIFGAEMGTNLALTTGIADQPGGTLHNKSAPFQLSGGTPEISATFARTGSYSLKLSATAAAEWLSWTNAGALGEQRFYGSSANFPLIGRLCFYLPSLPAGDVEICAAWSSAQSATFWYRSASQKIGCVVGDTISPNLGTEVLSDATVSAGVWIGLDFRYDPRAAIPVCDWQVDYDSLDTTAAPVAQTQAVGISGSIFDVSEFVVGWKTAATATIYYDDVALCKQYGSYPLGDVRIALVKVDPAGTCTVTGTSTNFKTYTSNGTTATWTSATTLANLGSVPPIIGASSSGLTQVSVAASDYVEIPMATFMGAPNYALRAARWYVCGWAASTAVCTLAIRWHDGLAEYTFVNLGDHGFDNATAVWAVGMVRSAVANDYYELTQAKLDGLKVRVGWSDDATPDVGIHVVFLEVAYQPVTVFGSIEAEDAAFKLYVRLDPVSAAVVSLQATTPAGTRGATMSWTVSGVDGTQYVGPNTTGEKSLGASSIEEVTSYGLAPDAG